MSDTLELPNGDVVDPDDVFLFNGYPYRFAPVEGVEAAFRLVPLYWGGGSMDVPFEDHGELEVQWGPDSRGLLDDDEWRAWLEDARDDDRFGDEELDAIAAELFDEGWRSRIERLLGLR